MTTQPNVLVVDDDLPIRSLIAKVLERNGIGVITAKDGAEALRLFDATRFDTVVLDLMMPSMSGYEVLDYIEPRLGQYTAVIVVTAGGDPDLVRLQGRRVHSVIRKPFDIALLAEVVSSVAQNIAEAHRAATDPGAKVVVVEFKRA
jgi:DNA-binding response OmpR family regulator